VEFFCDDHVPEALRLAISASRANPASLTG
jgi:hypothetical protein